METTNRYNRNLPNEKIATAFLSCSLRNEDKPFVDMVERILIQHGITPFGTVGKYSFAPMNVAEHMKQNIPKADIIVIVATPRYIQRDLQTGEESYGLSEMVHVETGMAYMADKPVVVFVQEGTQVGNFLPKITEYIELSGNRPDLESKWSKIGKLLRSAYSIVKKIRDNESNKSLGNFAVGALAFIGSAVVLDSILSPSPRRRKRRN